MTQLAERKSPPRLDTQGRILIPVAIREQLGLKPGDALYLAVEDGKLSVMTLRESVRRVQRLVAAKTKGRSLVDELIAERRAEATRE